MAIAKKCGCGASFSHRAWDRLPSIGVMEDGSGKYALDCKNCPACGSTLAMPLRLSKTTTTKEATRE